MFWRIISRDDTGMILTKIACFHTEQNLPPPLIAADSQLINDLNVNLETIDTLDINSNNNNASNSFNDDSAHNQSKKNGKAEIDD